MEERSKWTDPAMIAVYLALVTYGAGIVWTNGRSVQANESMATNIGDVAKSVDKLRMDMAKQFENVQSQIAALPVQVNRIDNIQHEVDNIRVENQNQGNAISTLQQVQSALTTSVIAIRHDLQMIQEVSGAIPGRKK